MILYDYFRSSASYRVRITLNLKDLSYDVIPINLLTAEQISDVHLDRNPQGLVPTLDIEGEIITQSVAICEYLEESFPYTRPLLPHHPLERARVRSLVNIITCDIHPINNLRVLKYLVSKLDVTEVQKIEWYRHWIKEGFYAVEKQLVESKKTGIFCHGDTPTLADVCLVPQVFNANRFEVDMKNYPTIERITDACNNLDAFITAQPNFKAT